MSLYYDGVDVRLLEVVERRARERRLSVPKAWAAHARSRSYFEAPPSVVGPHRGDTLNALLVLDLLNIWFVNLSAVCLFRLAGDAADSEEDKSRTRVVMSLAGRIAADMSAVRLLISHGMDVQARQITRSISEGIDAIGRACLDGEFCSEFISKQDVDETAEVWRKYISKGKAKRMVYEAMAKAVGGEYGPEWDSHRVGEEAAMSAAVHPSFISGFMSLIPSFGEAEENGKGDIREASVRTVRYCNTRCTEYLLFDAVVSQTTDKIVAGIPVRIRRARSGYPVKLVRSLRDVIIHSQTYLWRLQSANEEETPTQ